MQKANLFIVKSLENREFKEYAESHSRDYKIFAVVRIAMTHLEISIERIALIPVLSSILSTRMDCLDQTLLLRYDQI